MFNGAARIKKKYSHEGVAHFYTFNFHIAQAFIYYILTPTKHLFYRESILSLTSCKDLLVLLLYITV